MIRPYRGLLVISVLLMFGCDNSIEPKQGTQKVDDVPVPVSNEGSLPTTVLAVEPIPEPIPVEPVPEPIPVEPVPYIPVLTKEDKFIIGQPVPPSKGAIQFCRDHPEKCNRRD